MEKLSYGVMRRRATTGGVVKKIMYDERIEKLTTPSRISEDEKELYGVAKTEVGLRYLTKYSCPFNKEFFKLLGIPDGKNWPGTTLMVDEKLTITVEDFIIKNEYNVHMKEECPIKTGLVLPDFLVMSLNIPEVLFGIFGDFWYVALKDQSSNVYEWRHRKAIKLFKNIKYLEFAKYSIQSRQVYRGIEVKILNRNIGALLSLTGYIVPIDRILHSWSSIEASGHKEKILLPILYDDGDIDVLNGQASDELRQKKSCCIANTLFANKYKWNSTHERQLSNWMDLRKFSRCLSSGESPAADDFIPVYDWDTNIPSMWQTPMNEPDKLFISKPECWTTGYVKVQKCSKTYSIQINSCVGHQIATLKEIYGNDTINTCDDLAMNSAITLSEDLKGVYSSKEKLQDKFNECLKKKDKIRRV